MSINNTMELTAELRWKKYQELVWSQQQIHLQILQNSKAMEEDGNESHGHGTAQASKPHQENGTEANDKTLEEKTKEIGDPWENFDAHAAFLGPTLWDKRQCLPYDGQDFKLEYVDLEEFLTENGIPVDEIGKSGAGTGAEQTSTGSNFLPGSFFAGPSRVGHSSGSDQKSDPNLSRSPSSTSSSSTLSRDMTPAVSPDSTQSFAVGEFPPVPGELFDPRMRSFTEDELKPQPMVKKSRKQFVPDDAKDAKYWVRRRKNNMAAKRSRDARRVKENQIAMRACYLEKEYQFVREELERVRKENTMLKEQLSRYSIDHHH